MTADSRPMPVPVDGFGPPRPLHDVQATRALEARARTGLEESALMRRAARGVARLARALAPHARRVFVACGPGGNGGDGLHAAADLQALGLEVTICLAADPQRLAEAPRQGLERARVAGCRFVDGPAEAARVAAGTPGGFDLCIDALLGVGSRRPPEGRVAELVHELNAQTAPCLSVDLPTGLDPDTGQACVGVTVRAQATLSLLTCKPGLFTGDGRDCAGAVWFDDLGCATADAGPPCARLSSLDDLRAAQPTRRHAQHKGSFGDVVVVGGDRGMTGAARLAAHAALAAGPGRTLLSLLVASAAPQGQDRPEWLWSEQAWLPGRLDLERATVVCGCGGGLAVREAMPALLARAARLVLDADALNAVARDPALRSLLRARGRGGRPAVLTPHPLEAARLLGCTTPEVQADRLKAAHALAHDLQALVVLKGSGSVIAHPDSRTPVINGTGSAALATGGTGDVLAGWIGGTWAQAEAATVPPGNDGTGWMAAVASVWLHGAAAQVSGGRVVRALDLVEEMRRLGAPTG